MKALVTGGAGFIGSNIVKALLMRGDEVVVLDDLSSGTIDNLRLHSGFHFIEGDIRSKQVVAEAVRDVEVIFHLAASVGNKRSVDQPIRDSEINVIGTLRILEAARESGVRKIVASSSAGTYGELKTIPIREDHPMEPDTPYGASKLCGEKQCLAYAHLYELEAICLRYFNVYGPNQRYDAYGNAIPIFAFQMLHSEPITIYGDGEQTRDFVNVHDVVQANLRAGDTRGVTGAFNIGSGNRITINHLIEVMSDIAGMRPIVTHGPPRPGDVRHSVADITRAREAFGYHPDVSIPEGMAEYMEWASRL